MEPSSQLSDVIRISSSWSQHVLMRLPINSAEMVAAMAVYCVGEHLKTVCSSLLSLLPRTQEIKLSS